MTIGETIADFLWQIGIVAVHEATVYRYVHEGRPARLVALDRSAGLTFVALVEHGQMMMIHRDMRLLIEPIDQVVLHPPTVLQQRWCTS